MIDDIDTLHVLVTHTQRYTRHKHTPHRGFQEQTKVIYKETSNMTNHFTIHVSLYKTVALGPKATGSIVARWAPNIRSIASARFEPAVF